jgi:dCTP deaminase
MNLIKVESLKKTDATGVIPGHRLRELAIITPFCERTSFEGLTYGVGPAGYDIRLGEDCCLLPDCMSLTVSLEHLAMPDDVIARVHDKSTWARQGITVQNTIVEPGWRGHLTLELIVHRISSGPGSPRLVKIGTPIAQLIFERLCEPAKAPYDGKYQNQGPRPQNAILE